MKFGTFSGLESEVSQPAAPFAFDGNICQFELCLFNIENNIFVPSSCSWVRSQSLLNMKNFFLIPIAFASQPSGAISVELSENVLVLN